MSTFFCLHNAHGDITQLLDEKGQVIKDYRYDPYGNEEDELKPTFSGKQTQELWRSEVEKIDNPFRYCGEYLDEETGNYYLRARYYDPSIQRFVNEDSYGVERGAAWKEHLYGYGTNNPIRFIDPSGHFDVDARVDYERKQKERKKKEEAAKKKVLINKQQLEQIFEESGHFQADMVTDDMVTDLNRVLVKYDINTSEQIKYFLAVTLHESRLSLTEAGWCSRDSVKKYCEQYEPETKKGKELGNTKDGDGFLFRGAGYIQLTGRDNYQAFANEMDDQEIMKKGADYVAQKYAWEVAGYYWKKNGINNIIAQGKAKKQDDILTFKQVSNAVNRGPTRAYVKAPPGEWSARKEKFEIVKSILK